MEALMVESEVSNWNDDRLDELNRRVDDGFKAVDQRFERVEQRFEQVATREEIGEVKGQLERVNDRIDRLMYTMMATGVGMVGTVLIGVVGLILRG